MIRAQNPPDEAPIEWRIPDWRDERAYPPAWADVGVFAWEFARRSQRLRDTWLAAEAEDPGNPNRLDPRRPGWELVEQNGKDGISMDGRLLLIFSNGVTLHHANEQSSAGLGRVPSGGLHVAFDCTRPLKLQLDRAMRLLRYEQERLERNGVEVIEQAPKHQPKLSPRRLRVLDARSGGETSSTIAAVLLPHESGKSAISKIEADYVAAVKLRDHQWHEFAFLSQP